MDWSFLQSIALGLARAGGASLAGWLIKVGVASADQGPTIAGAVVLAVTIGFTVLDKFVVKGKVQTAAVTGVVK